MFMEHLTQPMHSFSPRLDETILVLVRASLIIEPAAGYNIIMSCHLELAYSQHTQ
jgi:hypothetical protein